MHSRNLWDGYRDHFENQVESVLNYKGEGSMGVESHWGWYVQVAFQHQMWCPLEQCLRLKWDYRHVSQQVHDDPGKKKCHNKNQIIFFFKIVINSKYHLKCVLFCKMRMKPFLIVDFTNVRLNYSVFRRYNFLNWPRTAVWNNLVYSLVSFM